MGRRIGKALFFGAWLAGACGGRSDYALVLSEDAGRQVDSGNRRIPPPRAEPTRTPRGPDAPSSPGSMTMPMTDATSPSEDAAIDRSVPEHDGASRPVGDRSDAADDASDGATRDGSLDAVADALSAPDCSCPAQSFYLNASTGTSALNLRAPYPLGIYCEETAVQLGHPPCSDVYRLSACNGPDFAPPCFYMAVSQSSGLLLGNYVDATGALFDVVDGSISPEIAGRVGIGSFIATLEPRAGGATTTLRGAFRACVPRFPSC
jgi:hypothetical protein